MEMVQNILTEQKLGMLHLQQEKLKETALPEPKRLIDILESTMPL